VTCKEEAKQLGEITVKQITRRSVEQVKWDFYFDYPEGKSFKRYLRGRLAVKRIKDKWAVTFTDLPLKYTSVLYTGSDRAAAMKFADRLVMTMHKFIIPTERIERMANGRESPSIDYVIAGALWINSE